MSIIVSKSHGLYKFKTTSAQYKKRRPQENAGVVPAKYHPNVELENFYNSKAPEFGRIMRT